MENHYCLRNYRARYSFENRLEYFIELPSMKRRAAKYSSAFGETLPILREL